MQDRRPKALDLFCCAGGASMGLYRAGFDLVGVDNRPQPRYPFTFHQGDALTYPLEGFDFIWASPPCQAYTPASYTVRKTTGIVYPTLVEATRRRLESSGALWVIENVPGAPLRLGAIQLCGLSFGLQLIRHRRFESSFPMLAPPHIRHKRGAAIRREVFTVFGKPRSQTNRNRGVSKPYASASHTEAQRALGIDWMIYAELAESVPPAFAEFVGNQARAALNRDAMRETA